MTEEIERGEDFKTVRFELPVQRPGYRVISNGETTDEPTTRSPGHQALDNIQAERDELIATKAEYESLYQFAWDNYRRANRAQRHVERLTEENRSLVQTIRRVLRGTPVNER